jgi:hypothetical protein
VELDEAVEFYAAYLDALYRYEVAVRTEPDDLLADRRARAHTFLDPLRGTIQTLIGTVTLLSHRRRGLFLRQQGLDHTDLRVPATNEPRGYACVRPPRRRKRS